MAFCHPDGSEPPWPAFVATHRLGHRVGDLDQGGLVDAIHVAEVAGLTAHDPHGGTALCARPRILHAAVVEGDAEVAPVLGVQLPEVPAAGQRPRDHALGQLW
nr:hypothetical protein [Thermoleophilaceae bacterium]